MTCLLSCMKFLSTEQLHVNADLDCNNKKPLHMDTNLTTTTQATMKKTRGPINLRLVSSRPSHSGKVLSDTSIICENSTIEERNMTLRSVSMDNEKSRKVLNHQKRSSLSPIKHNEGRNIKIFLEEMCKEIDFTYDKSISEDSMENEEKENKHILDGLHSNEMDKSHRDEVSVRVIQEKNFKEDTHSKKSTQSINEKKFQTGSNKLNKGQKKSSLTKLRGKSPIKKKISADHSDESVTNFQKLKSDLKKPNKRLQKKNSSSSILTIESYSSNSSVKRNNKNFETFLRGVKQKAMPQSSPYIQYMTPSQIFIHNPGMTPMPYMAPNYIPVHMPHYNQSNYHPNHYPSMNSTFNQMACYYCEEIYKYIIMNNLPLKQMTCLYCHKQMNLGALEFFLYKYKVELDQIYKQKLSSLVDHTDEIRTTDYRSTEPYITKKKSKDDFDIVASANINKISLIEDEDVNESMNKKNYESSNMLLDTTDTGLSLAEIFKSKRANLLNKIESRAKSVKNKSSSDFFNLEMRNIQIHKNKKHKRGGSKLNMDLNSIVEERDKVSSHIKRNSTKSIPNPELMDRLIKGKRVKMTPKEIKEVNKRLYGKLVEVKYQHIENDKKEEFRRRVEVRKVFTEKLKQDVIKRNPKN